MQFIDVKSVFNAARWTDSVQFLCIAEWNSPQATQI